MTTCYFSKLSVLPALKILNCKIDKLKPHNYVNTYAFFDRRKQKQTFQVKEKDFCLTLNIQAFNIRQGLAHTIHRCTHGEGMTEDNQPPFSKFSKKCNKTKNNVPPFRFRPKTLTPPHPPAILAKIWTTPWILNRVHLLHIIVIHIVHSSF